jgi:hypothetical protein
MPAGDTYDKYLNTTKGNSQTPCLYDPDVDEWMMPVRVYAHNIMITQTSISASKKCQHVQVLAANSSRKYALIVNDSDTTIYLKLGSAAAVHEGIRINANGGYFEMGAAQGNLYTGAVNAVHDGVGDKTLLVTEGE